MDIVKLEKDTLNKGIKMNEENLNIIFNNISGRTFEDGYFVDLCASAYKQLNTSSILIFIDLVLSKTNKYSKNGLPNIYYNAKIRKNTMEELIELLFIDNEITPEKLKDALLKLNVMEILSENKEGGIIHKNYNLNLKNTIKYDSKIHINFNDDNCIITNINHNKSLGYCEINPHGNVCFYCNHLDCTGKCKHGNNLNGKKIRNFFNENEITVVTKEYVYKHISKLIPNNLILEISEDNIFNDLFLTSLNNVCNEDIAQVIIYLCNDKFKYDGEWYEYRVFAGAEGNNLWSVSDNLDKFIRNEVKFYYKKIINLIEEYDNIEEQECNYIIKSIDKINYKFGSIDERSNLIKEAIILSKEKNTNFKNSLDTNNKVIHFTNGLYKIDDGKIIKHKPSHLITMTIGYEYRKKYSDNKNNLLKYLEDILPNEEVREYLLIYLGKCLCNSSEGTTTFLIGESKNLVELIKLTFGDYYSNETNVKNKRIYIIDNYDDTNNTKNIQLFICVNTFINDGNFELNNKNRYINFTHDVNIDNNLELYKQDFMILLLEYYSKYKDINNVPDSVLKIQKDVNNNSDLIVLKFLKDCTKNGGNIFSTTLYDYFKNWYILTYKDDKIIGRNNFLSIVKNYRKYGKVISIGKERSSGFINLRLK